jgi:hypothetical protein
MLTAEHRWVTPQREESVGTDANVSVTLVSQNSAEENRA